jgi:hypothetical protein
MILVISDLAGAALIAWLVYAFLSSSSGGDPS